MHFLSHHNGWTLLSVNKYIRFMDGKCSMHKHVQGQKRTDKTGTCKVNGDMLSFFVIFTFNLNTKSLLFV